MPHPEKTEKQEAPKFNLDTALNTKGFAEYLEKYDDHEDLDFSSEESLEEVAKRYEAFQNKDLASKELKNIYKGAFEAQLGIKFDKSDLESIDAYIEAQAIENPESIKELLEQSKQFNELPAKINEAEKKMNQMLGGEDLEFKKDRLATKVAQKEAMLEARKSAKGFKKNLPLIGRFFRSEEESRARQKSVQEWEEDLDIATRNLEALESPVQAKEKMTEQKEDLHKMFFNENFAPLQVIAEKAREKAQKKFYDFYIKDDLKSIEKAQQCFEQMSDAQNNLKVEVLKGMPEDQQEKLDTLLEANFNIEFQKAIEKFDVKVSSPLTKLEKTLKTYLEREGLGSKDKVETLSFLKDKLEDEIEKASGAKKLHLKAILAKLENNLQQIKKEKKKRLFS